MMDERRRTLLNLRVIRITYESAIRGASKLDHAHAQERLGQARQAAEHLLNSIESRLLARGAIDAEIRLQLRVARDAIARADRRARGVREVGERPTDQTG